MRLIANAAFLWVVRIATMASSAAVSVLTARFLGPHGRGFYALPALDASLAITFAVGLSSALTYVMLKRGAGSGIARSALYGMLFFVLGGSIATVATAIVTHSVWAAGPAIAMTAFYIANSIACGYFIGRDRVRTASTLNATAYLLTLVLVAASLVVFKTSARAAIAAWVVAWAIGGTTSLALALRDARSRGPTPVDTRAMLRFAGKAGMLNLSNLLNYRVDLYVVAILLPVSTLGLYTIAVTGAESALSLTLAIAQSSMPAVGSSGRERAGALVARCLRNGIFFSAILSLVAYALAPSLVRLVLGAAYVPLVAPFRVLSIGVVAASTTAVLSNYFMLALGRARVPVSIALLSAALCAIVSVALVPRIGMLGAAIGSTVAYACSQAFAIALFCRESGISPANALLIDAEDLATYRRVLRRILAVPKAPA